MSNAARAILPRTSTAAAPVALPQARHALIGAITAGLGHDLRNAVMPALLRLETLAASPDVSRSARSDLHRIRDSLLPLQHLASGLHLLSADTETADSAPSITDLSQWWRQLEPLVVAASAPGTHVTTNLPNRLRAVEIPARVLSHVVMALVLNAREWMKGSESPRLIISATSVSRGVELTVQHACPVPVGALPTAGPRPASLESPLEALTGHTVHDLRTQLKAFGADLTEVDLTADGGAFMLTLLAQRPAGQIVSPLTRSRRSTDTPARPVARAFSVLCIDDNELLVDALEGRLALEEGFGQLHRAAPLTEAAAIAQHVRPELILLDYDLPDGIDAMELLVTLVRALPESRVIVFTGHVHGQLIARSMHGGASGFVSKGASVERLLEAMQRVLRGEAVIELDA